MTLELEGPLAQGSLQVEGYAALSVQAELLPGERRSARAWMVGPDDPLDWPDTLVADGIRATPVGGGFRCPDWARRVGPALIEGSGGGGLPGLTGVLAALVAAVGSIAVLRAHRIASIARALGLGALGAVGALGAWHLASPAGRLPGDQAIGLPVAVLEGRRPGARLSLIHI